MLAVTEIAKGMGFVEIYFQLLTFIVRTKRIKQKNGQAEKFYCLQDKVSCAIQKKKLAILK